MSLFDNLSKSILSEGVSLNDVRQAIGEHRARAAAGHAICPQCDKEYALPPNPQTDTEREMHMSGICSDACWDKLMGPPPDDTCGPYDETTLYPDEARRDREEGV